MQNISADLISFIAYACLYMLVDETKMCPGKVWWDACIINILDFNISCTDK